MMEQLRVLTADRIREFHREMYQPKNLSLVLIGEIDQPELLQILDEFEATIMDDIPSPETPFQRPWVESKRTPPLKKTIVDTVKFPEDDESMGEVLIGFLGPDCNDHLQASALGIMLIYLCGSSVSVLENTLVEKEQLCSMIYYSTDVRPDIAFWFNLSAVETKKLADAEKRLFEVLKETASKNLDMGYMKDCLSRYRRQLKFKCESTGDFFATPIIEDHLFGNRDGTDLRELETLKDLDVLEGWSDQQWRDYLSKWFADAHHVSILGVPSKELSKKLKTDEKARVKAQKEKLGEEGLKKLAEKLDQAKAENDKPIPDEVLSQFPVPGTSSIHFIPTTTARAGRARQMGKLDNEIQQIVDKDDSDIPLFIHFEHIPSNFVRTKLVMCTGSLPTELKPLLSLYLSNFFMSPITRDGKRVEFEDVVTELEKDTVDYDINSGPGNGELLQITFQVEAEKYSAMIDWLRTTLFSSVLDKERLQTAIVKMLADIPDEKRSGMDMATSVDSMIHLTRDSSSRSRNTLVKSVYLKRLKKHLAKDPEYVFSRLQSCIDTLHRPSNFRVYVAANIQTLSNPVSAWKSLLSKHDDNTSLQPLDSRKSKLSEIAKKPGNTAYIIPLSTIDSSYALLTSRGPDSWSHPDLPALMVAQSYLDAVEGPLWAAVRGTGLAYGTGFSRSVDVGLLTLRIYRSPDTFKAFLAAKTEVENYATGTTPFDKFALEGAVSSIIMGFADEQPTMGSAANLSFVNQVIRGIPKNWNDEMLEKVRRVSEDEIKDVLKRLIMPIFNPESTNLVVTCATIMEEVCLVSFSQTHEDTITNISHRTSSRLSQMQDSSLKSRHCRTLKTTTDLRTLKVLKMRKRKKMRRKKKKKKKKKMAARKMIQRVRMKSRLLL
jgi:Zn-dependent M16 (insulinase) family peptidase